MTIKNIHIDNIDSNNNNTIILNEPLKKIKSIQLNHFHCNTINNIREENNSNKIEFSINKPETPFNFNILPNYPNNYDSNNYILNLQILCDSIDPNNIITISYSLINTYYNNLDDIINELNNYIYSFIQDNNSSIFYNDDSLSIVFSYDGNYIYLSISSNNQVWYFNAYIYGSNSLMYNIGFSTINANSMNFSNNSPINMSVYNPVYINCVANNIHSSYTDIHLLCSDLTQKINESIAQQYTYEPINFIINTRENNTLICINHLTNNIVDINLDTRQTNAKALGFDDYDLYYLNIYANNPYDATLFNKFSTFYTISLPKGNYTNDNFIVALNNLIYTPSLPDTINLAYSISGNNILDIYYTNSENYETLQLKESLFLRKIFNITNFNPINSGEHIIGNSGIYYDYDAYLNIYISNLNNNTNIHSGNKISTFKIPITDIKSKIIYNSNNNFINIIYNSDESFILNRLTINFYDRQNNEIIIDDYSLSLLVECD